MEDMENNDFNEVYERALKILDFAPQMGKILYLKLMKKGYDRNIIREVIIKLTELGLINDDHNAENYISEMINKLYGKNKMMMKLEEKGIKKEKAKELINARLEEIGGEEEIAYKFIKKNDKIIKETNEKGGIDKIRSKLFNRGFTYEVINRVLRKTDEF